LTAQTTSRAILLLLLLGALALPSPAQADPACEADYCTIAVTKPDGRYQLTIPPHVVGFFFEELAGCTWTAVEAQYGDGSEAGEYEFGDAEGLEAEHTYPEPGVYIFHAYATEGLHDGTSEACPDFHVQATVTYPEPPPLEPEEPEPEEPVRGPAGGSAVAAPPQIQLPDLQLPVPATERFWRDCGKDIRAHRVPCPRARRVIAAARSILTRARPSERLAQGAVFKAGGFSCRLRDDAAGSVSCWRGRQRALGT
jgi:hypothetical protein